MTFDMKSLIDNAASTGTVTTGSYLLGSSTPGPVYDVTPTNVTATLNVFDRVVPAVQPQSYFPKNSYNSDEQNGQNLAMLGYRVIDILKKRDRAKTPKYFAKSCFREVIYIALVRYFFDTAESDVREQIIRELGGDLENIQSLGRSLAAEQIFPDCNVIEFVMQQINRPPLQSALVLGDLLEMSPENCFETFPVVATASSGNGSIPVSSGLVPRHLMVDGKGYSLQDIDYQHDFSGNIDQAVCLYAADAGNLFTVIATRVVKNRMGVLTIGERAATAWPFSYTSMPYCPNAHIIFPMCKLTSLYLRRLWREAKQLEREVIISGQFGDSASLYLDSFRGHPVTLIPEFSRDGFLEIRAFAQRLLNAGALSVSVYPWPIRAEGVPAEIFTNTNCSPWKQELLKRLVTLDSIEIVSAFARRITETALPLTNFEALLSELGLTNQPETPQLALADELHIPTLDEVNKDCDGVDFEGNPSLETLIKPGFILFIWGGYNSGKTFVLLMLIIGVATGQRAFCFESNGQPRVIGVLDGELTPAQFSRRIEQLSANNPQKELLKTNIRPLLARDPKVGPIDLLDAKFQERLLQTIKRLNITVLVIDNLISLASKALKGREDDLFSFFYRLERMGVAVVFVNHAKKDNNDFKGSVDLGSKSQTIIHVEGRNVLEEDANVSDAVKAALANDGDAVVRLTYTKCKVPPRLNQKHEVYHLPVGGTWLYIEGNVTDVEPLTPSGRYKEPGNPAASLPVSENVMEPDTDPADTGAVHDKSATVPSLESENTLTHDQQRLYERFQANTLPLSRNDIEKEFSWGEDKAGNELKTLKDMRFIKGIGSGRSSAYVKV